MTETTANAQVGFSDNAAGALAYITFLPAIVFLFLPPYSTRPYVRFHAWQSLYLHIAAFIVGLALDAILVFGSFSGGFLAVTVTRVLWIGWMLLWAMCAVTAVNGRRFMLPLIGALAEKRVNG
jgi:uncharacterized membrane protein